MAANHRLLHPNCCCGDCVYLRIPDGAQEGFCSEAAEALALEGWPKVTVLIEPDMSAESCPMFEDKRAPYGPDEAADDAYQARKEGAA